MHLFSEIHFVVKEREIKTSFQPRKDVRRSIYEGESHVKQKNTPVYRGIFLLMFFYKLRKMLGNELGHFEHIDHCLAAKHCL